MKSLKGSTALITGASKGLGAAYARALAERGADLVLTARSADALQILAAELTVQYGVHCMPIAVDLATSDAAQSLADEIDKCGLKIDLLINNAGLGLTGTFLSHNIHRELAVVQVNVEALLVLSHLFGAKMVLRGGGGIVNIASNAAFMPLPSMAVYAASKAFVLHFTEALRHELGKSGIQVMAVCPGPTATSFFEGRATAMKDTTFDSAEQVATRSLDDFMRGRSVSYPSRASVRLGTLAPRLFPRDFMVRIAATAIKKMGLETA